MGDETRQKTAERGYGSKWRTARDAFLREHPLCVECQAIGRVEAATVVDHIEPHRGDRKLFWGRGNWQALCKRCHDSHKQRLEKGGGRIGCGLDGVPLDRAHHWHGSWRVADAVEGEP